MRRDLIPNDVVERRRSVRWFAQADASSPLKAKLFLFHQDVHVRVVPYGGRSTERPDFRVRTNPATKAAASAVVRTIAGGTDTPSGDLQSDVCDFITNAASRLLLYGRAVYEVVIGDDGQRYLFPLPPGRLVQIGPVVGQVVPANPYEKAPRRIVWLQRRDLLWLTPPAGLGGWRLARLRRTLRSAESIPPDWSLPRPDQPSTDFDLSAFVYKTDVVVGTAVRDWGWPAPHPARQQMTNYHQVREHLRFAVTMARMREHILANLNRELARTVSRVAVEIDGLPTAADLETVMGRFSKGEIAFTEAIAATQW